MKGAVVFVADSQKEMREQNKENLISNNIDPDSIPVVLQYNKRDLPNLLLINDLNRDLNKKGYPYLEAEVLNGKGVTETVTVKIPEDALKTLIELKNNCWVKRKETMVSVLNNLKSSLQVYP